MKYLIIPFLMLNFSALAQIKVMNAEQYKLGSHIVYQPCSVSSFDTGVSGSNVVWDYSQLQLEGSQTTIDIKRSSETRFASNLKYADLVEIDSDSNFVFFSQDDSISKLEYFVSIEGDIKMSYPKAQVFMRRPMEYLSRHYSDYKATFSYGPYVFSGSGKSIIESDGYGNLILPNGEFKDVLRVKMIQSQQDTLLLNRTIHKSISTTYLWFDGISPEPLLKINQFKSSLGITESISYKVYSNTTDISSYETTENLVYPIPAQSTISITNLPKTALNYKIINLVGKTVQTGVLEKESINITSLANGIYYLHLDKRPVQRIIKK